MAKPSYDPKTVGFYLKDIRESLGMDPQQFVRTVHGMFPTCGLILTEQTLWELEEGLTNQTVAEQLATVLRPFFDFFFQTETQQIYQQVSQTEQALMLVALKAMPNPAAQIPPEAPVRQDSPLHLGHYLNATELLQAEEWFPGVPEDFLAQERVSLGSRPGTSGSNVQERWKKEEQRLVKEEEKRKMKPEEERKKMEEQEDDFEVGWEELRSDVSSDDCEKITLEYSDRPDWL